MMDAWAQSEVERIIANLVRVGVVTDLDAVHARVKVRAGGLVTDWIPWLAARAGATRTWSAPRVGEQVVVLAPYGDPSQAIALPAMYQDAYPAPATSADVEQVTLPDGSTVIHNSATNTLSITVAGDAKVVINCKEATINAATSLTVTAPNTTINGDVQINGTNLKHNAKNIGATHIHGGVQAGAGTSGVPS